MKRIALIIVITVLCWCVMTGDSDARTINLRESLDLAVGDTISAQTVMDSIGAIQESSGKLICDSLVVSGVAMHHDTVRCALIFSDATFTGSDTVSYHPSARRLLGADIDTMATGDTVVYAYTVRLALIFSGATFQREVNFEGATFQGIVSFDGATFQESAEFRDATFQGYAFFQSVVFQDRASFVGVTFQRFALFGGTTFERVTRFEGATFGGMASFADCVAPNGIYVEWSQLDEHVMYHRSNYFFLMRNFEQLGYTDDYDACYYDFRVQMRKNELKWYTQKRWLELVFLDLTCGYGVKPFRAILWAGCVIFLFSLIYTKRGAIELRVERETCNGIVETGEPCSKHRVWGTEFCPEHQHQATWFRRLKNAFYFSMGTFTTVGYGDWHPSGKYRYWAMAQGLLGWLLLALFVVTLDKTWVR